MEAADRAPGDTTHRLVIDVDGYAEGGTERTVVLHAFNHAPREMGAAACEAEQRRHAHAAAVEHARLHEPLSGRPLSVLDQCVPLTLRALRPPPPPPPRPAAAGPPRPTPPTGAAASQLARVSRNP